MTEVTGSYKVKQLAQELGCSYTRARRLALDEGGTLRIPSKEGRRSMMCIPAAVFVLAET